MRKYTGQLKYFGPLIYTIINSIELRFCLQITLQNLSDNIQKSTVDHNISTTLQSMEEIKVLKE